MHKNITKFANKTHKYLEFSLVDRRNMVGLYTKSLNNNIIKYFLFDFICAGKIMLKIPPY